MKMHDIATIFGALAGVIVMILLTRFGSRSIGFMSWRRPGTGRLALETSLAIDPRRRISLVRCDGHHLLILTGGSADMILGWLPETGAVRLEDRS